MPPEWFQCDASGAASDEPITRPQPGQAPQGIIGAARNTFYLAVMDGWVQSSSLEGPCSLAAHAPFETLDQIKKAALAANQNQILGNNEQSLTDAYEEGEAPTIYVSIAPTELLLTQDEPQFTPIPGTALSYVSNTADDIFRDSNTRQNYVLIGGRWFTALSLQDGPWTYVPATSLPADFASIPDSSPKASVLVSIPGTPQAKEALIANQIPQTATISRTAAQVTVKYDGPPEFRPIQGIEMTYALNSPTPVIAMPDGSYYACQTGVWFRAPAAAGPWAVATSVPLGIYSIPPSSPHLLRHLREDLRLDTRLGLRRLHPGYYGTVLSSDGVVVYGTGYVYPPYVGATSWLPAPATYGVGAAFS
jgi:hypothetical protein